mmetsp:Transcript_36509/g.114434  ORF Transcript_36509/g.114434 Transcript_36509/m.114434 type:complete len:298 (-) Transcript_36509:573-1466(-)
MLWMVLPMSVILSTNSAMRSLMALSSSFIFCLSIFSSRSMSSSRRLTPPGPPPPPPKPPPPSITTSWRRISARSFFSALWFCRFSTVVWRLLVMRRNSSSSSCVLCSAVCRWSMISSYLASIFSSTSLRSIFSMRSRCSASMPPMMPSWLRRTSAMSTSSCSFFHASTMVRRSEVSRMLSPSSCFATRMSSVCERSSFLCAFSSALVSSLCWCRFLITSVSSISWFIEFSSGGTMIWCDPSRSSPGSFSRFTSSVATRARTPSASLSFRSKRARVRSFSSSKGLSASARPTFVTKLS